MVHIPTLPSTTTKKGATQVKFPTSLFQYQRRNAWYLPWHPVRALRYPLYLILMSEYTIIITHFCLYYHRRDTKKKQKELTTRDSQSKETRTRNIKGYTYLLQGNILLTHPLCIVFCFHITLPHFNRNGRKKQRRARNPHNKTKTSFIPQHYHQG